MPMMVLLVRRLRFKRIVVSTLIVIAAFAVIDSILHEFSQYGLTSLSYVGLNVRQEQLLLTVNVVNERGKTAATGGSRQKAALKVANMKSAVEDLEQEINRNAEDRLHAELSTVKPMPITPKGPTKTDVPTTRQTTINEHILNLIDPYRFEYIINEPETCTPETELLIYAHTALENKKRRRIVRQTWGNRRLLKKYNIKLRFFMGSREDARLMADIKNESLYNGDIIQDSYIDSYRNLTYKGISTLKWIRTYCSDTRLVLKIDDDVIVNVVNVTHYIRSILSKKNESCDGWLQCYVWKNAPVSRNQKSKWFLTKEEFPYKRYPPYCAGAVVLLSNDTIQKLFHASIGQPYFWIDDVFLFGILAQKAGLKHRMFDGSFIFSDTRVLDYFRQGKSTPIMFTHSTKINTIYLLWKIIELRTPELNNDHPWE